MKTEELEKYLAFRILYLESSIKVLKRFSNIDKNIKRKESELKFLKEEMDFDKFINKSYPEIKDSIYKKIHKEEE